jgi:predicted small integral membrane protein
LGFILNNQRGLHLKGNVGNFGANQNTFIGGRIGISSQYVAANCRKILMTTTESNGNQFTSVNLEAGASELAVDCASGGNVWTNCRLEAGTAIAGFITFTATAHDNKFIGGLGSSAIVVGAWSTMVSDAGLGNTFMFGSTISSKKLTIDMQADTPIKLGSGSAAPAYPIGPYGADRMRFGYNGSPGARYYGTLMQEEIVQTTGTTLATSGNFHQLNYASPTTITGAISGGTDQTTAALLAVIDIVGNITLQHTAGPAAAAGKFVIKAAADKVLTANVPVLFVACNGNFYEV